MPKVMIQLPKDLLAALDAGAERRSLSRSALLALAATRELRRRDPATMLEAIARCERRFQEGGSFEAADLVRADRDSRR